MKKDKTNNLLSEFFEWMEAILFSCCVALFVLLYMFKIVEVQGESMLPTLEESERLVAISLFYVPENGDIVVVNRENEPPIIKRVIAYGGQEIDFDFSKGEVFVDGVKLDEPYINEATLVGEGLAFTYPLVVPEGYYFVMGDNRNMSKDSRFEDIGLVHRDQIFGEIAFRISPFDRFGFVDEGKNSWITEL